jgi:hypothetical protein
MAFAPALGSIGGVGPRLLSAIYRAHGATIDHRSRPINSAGARQPIEYGEVDEIPHTGQLPVAQASPARHPRAAAQFLRQHLPGDAAAEDKENAGQACAIREARPSAFSRRGGVGKNGSTRSHNGSESSATAIARSDYLASGPCSSAVRRSLLCAFRNSPELVSRAGPVAQLHATRVSNSSEPVSASPLSRCPARRPADRRRRSRLS